MLAAGQCHPRHRSPAAFISRKNKTPTAFAIGVSEFNLDDDLLSHGETPHYHRRCIVSLLSSGWDQVVPTLYGRQEIRVLSRLSTYQQIGYVIALCVCKLSVCFVFTHRNSLLKQIAWVLYGQASRAISIG